MNQILCREFIKTLVVKSGCTFQNCIFLFGKMGNLRFLITQNITKGLIKKNATYE